MGITVSNDIKIKPGSGQRGGGKPEPPNDPGRGEDWPPGFSRDDAIEPAKYRIGMWVGIASILMLFSGLVSAYIYRQAQSAQREVSDWVPIQMPRVLWISTAVILAGSVTIELARRALRRNQYERFRTLIMLTALLGLGFLGGQWAAWRELTAQGVYISTNPHSSFFYVLTVLHAVHLLGGLIAIAFVAVQAARLRITRSRRQAVEVTSLYWHFMDGLWVFLFALLFFY